MRMKSRRTLAILLSMMLLLALAPSGFAVDLKASNAVTVTLADPKSGYAEDLRGTRVQADLYLLAEAEPIGNSDSYTYALPESKSDPLYAPLEALVKELNGAEKPEEAPTQEAVFQQFEHYAQDFAGIVLGSTYNTAPVTGDIVVDQPAITVTGLKSGLYLLVIHGYGMTKTEDLKTGYIKKTTQAASEEGAAATSVLTTRVFTDSNEYLFRPQLLTVPTKVDATTGQQQYSTLYGDWSNTLMLYAKPTLVPKNGDLKIIKDLSSVGPDPVTFVFEVAWSENGKNFKKYVSMTFEGGSLHEEYLLRDTVPVGTEVWVTEVHTGIAYSVTSENPQKVTIQAKPPVAEGAAAAADDGSSAAQVKFTNTHSGPGGGYGLLNHFTATGSDFKWVKYKDSNDAVPAVNSES